MEVDGRDGDNAKCNHKIRFANAAKELRCIVAKEAKERSQYGCSNNLREQMMKSTHSLHSTKYCIVSIFIVISRKKKS